MTEARTETRETAGEAGQTAYACTEAWMANLKRMFDEYQQLSLEQYKNLAALFNKQMTDAMQHDNTRQNISNQALQNAVETANMIGKQSIRHNDVAFDFHWNPVETAAGNVLTARAVSIDDASLKAIGALVAEAVASAVAGRPPVNVSGQ